MTCLAYKPQWAYPTPDGARDEVFLIPFSFEVPADGKLYQGFPLQLDDDVPYIIRGIVFPQIGLHPVTGGEQELLHPALCRIVDSHGNQLSDGLILTLGAWCQSGYDDANGIPINAFGFPIEQEVENEPGGVVTFDFQVSTNAAIATLELSNGGAGIDFSANVFGVAGNAYTVQLIDPGAPNIPLSVAVVAGVNVQVTLATDGLSALTTTYPEIEALINGDAAASALVRGQSFGGVLVVAAAAGPTALAGGEASSTVTLQGTLLGVKRFRGC